MEVPNAQESSNPMKPRQPPKTSSIHRPVEPLSKVGGNRPGRVRCVAKESDEDSSRAFGEDISNKITESVNLESLTEKKPNIAPPMKPRAPPAKSTNGNRPGTTDPRKNVSYHQPKKQVQLNILTTKEESHKETTPVTPQKSSPTQEGHTPSAAAFVSPQPFLYRAPQENPFATPMLQFVDPSSSLNFNDTNKSNDNDINNNDDDEEESGNGLYAEGDDFAKLLNDLDEIERKVLDAHESPDPNVLSESPMEVLLRNSGDLVNQIGINQCTKNNNDEKDKHDESNAMTMDSESRKSATDVCPDMCELIRNQSLEMQNEPMTPVRSSSKMNSEFGNETDSESDNNSEYRSEKHKVYDFGPTPLAPLDAKSVSRGEQKVRSQQRKEDHQFYIKALAAAKTPPRERRRRRAGSLGSGVKLKGHRHRHSSMRVIPESDSLMLTRMGANSLKPTQPNDDDEEEEKLGADHDVDKADRILPVYLPPRRTSTTHEETEKLIEVDSSEKVTHERLPTPAYLPRNRSGEASSKPIVNVSRHLKYQPVPPHKRNHYSGIGSALGKSRHRDAYGRWMESQAIVKGNHTSIVLSAIKSKNFDELAICFGAKMSQTILKNDKTRFNDQNQDNEKIINDENDNEKIHKDENEWIPTEDVDVRRDDHGNTALILCAMAGWRGGCRMLLKWGSRLNATNRHGNCALHFASEFGRRQVESFLLRKCTGYFDDENNVDSRVVKNVRGLRWNERSDPHNFAILTQNSSHPALVGNKCPCTEAPVMPIGYSKIGCSSSSSISTDESSNNTVHYMTDSEYEDTEDDYVELERGESVEETVDQPSGDEEEEEDRGGW